MSDQDHRIRSIRWKANTESPEEGFRLREYLRNGGGDAFLAVAQEAFDEAAGEGDLLYIPRLEVSVKIDPAVGITAEERQALLARLRDQLRGGNSGVGASSEEDRRERNSVEMSRLEILLHYLRTGSLPWHADKNAAAGAAGLAATASEYLEGVVRELSGAPGQSIAPWLRLLLLLPESAFPVYSAVLVAPLPLECFGMIPLLTALLEKRTYNFPRPLALLVAAHASQAVRTGRPVLQTLEQQLSAAEWKQFVEFLEDLPEAAREAIGSLPAATAAKTPGSSTFQNIPEPDHPEGARESIGSVPAGEKIQVASMPTGPVPIPSTVFSSTPLRANAPSPEISAVSSPVQAGMPGDEDHPFIVAPPQSPEPDLFPILVENAGLLLLGPFLPRFLTNCGVLESGELAIPREYLPRAAALLNFLVTGEPEVHEFQLPLVKVLLGLHPTAPLPVCGELLEATDSEEVEALLNAAITHWQALKNTSHNGLRTTFLQRQGLLREEAEEWKMTVERTPVDILLDRLPWSFGMAKLPWMKKPVFVQW